MLTTRSILFAVVALLIAGLSLDVGLETPFPPSAFAQPPGVALDKESAKVKELLKERLDALRNLATQVEAAARQGSTSMDKAIEASQRVLEAEFELCETDKERIAIREKIVASAKQYEELAMQQVKLGVAPTTIVLYARVARLEAEIALERIKAKAK